MAVFKQNPVVLLERLKVKTELSLASASNIEQEHIKDLIGKIEGRVSSKNKEKDEFFSLGKLLQPKPFQSNETQDIKTQDGKAEQAAINSSSVVLNDNNSCFLDQSYTLVKMEEDQKLDKFISRHSRRSSLQYNPIPEPSPRLIDSETTNKIQDKSSYFFNVSYDCDSIKLKDLRIILVDLYPDKKKLKREMKMLCSKAALRQVKFQSASKNITMRHYKLRRNSDPCEMRKLMIPQSCQIRNENVRRSKQHARAGSSMSEISFKNEARIRPFNREDRLEKQAKNSLDGYVCNFENKFRSSSFEDKSNSENRAGISSDINGNNSRNQFETLANRNEYSSENKTGIISTINEAGLENGTQISSDRSVAGNAKNQCGIGFYVNENSSTTQFETFSNTNEFSLEYQVGISSSNNEVSSESQTRIRLDGNVGCFENQAIFNSVRNEHNLENQAQTSLLTNGNSLSNQVKTFLNTNEYSLEYPADVSCTDNEKGSKNQGWISLDNDAGSLENQAKSSSIENYHGVENTVGISLSTNENNLENGVEIFSNMNIHNSENQARNGVNDVESSLMSYEPNVANRAGMCAVMNEGSVLNQSGTSWQMNEYSSETQVGTLFYRSENGEEAVLNVSQPYLNQVGILSTNEYTVKNEACSFESGSETSWLNSKLHLGNRGGINFENWQVNNSVMKKHGSDQFSYPGYSSERSDKVMPVTPDILNGTSSLTPDLSMSSNTMLSGSELRADISSKRFPCALCARSFRNACDLKRHMKAHNGKRLFPCTLCSSTFRFETDLEQHLTRGHPNEKSFRCELCPASFRVNKYLRAHLRTHSNMKPFPCMLCTWAFRDASSLRRHMKTHGIERSYACENCTKTFKSNHSLKRHAKKVHPELVSCDLCSAKFETEQELRQHHASNTSEKRLQCPKCPKTFFFKKKLEMHLQKHSEESGLRKTVYGQSIVSHTLAQSPENRAETSWNFKDCRLGTPAEISWNMSECNLGNQVETNSKMTEMSFENQSGTSWNINEHSLGNLTGPSSKIQKCITENQAEICWNVNEYTFHHGNETSVSKLECSFESEAGTSWNMSERSLLSEAEVHWNTNEVFQSRSGTGWNVSEPDLENHKASSLKMIGNLQNGVGITSSTNEEGILRNAAETSFNMSEQCSGNQVETSWNTSKYTLHNETGTRWIWQEHSSGNSLETSWSIKNEHDVENFCGSKMNECTFENRAGTDWIMKDLSLDDAATTSQNMQNISIENRPGTRWNVNENVLKNHAGSNSETKEFHSGNRIEASCNVRKNSLDDGAEMGWNKNECNLEYGGMSSSRVNGSTLEIDAGTSWNIRQRSLGNGAESGSSIHDVSGQNRSASRWNMNEQSFENVSSKIDECRLGYETNLSSSMKQSLSNGTEVSLNVHSVIVENRRETGQNMNAHFLEIPTKNSLRTNECSGKNQVRISFKMNKESLDNGAETSSEIVKVSFDSQRGISWNVNEHDSENRTGSSKMIVCRLENDMGISWDMEKHFRDNQSETRSNMREYNQADEAKYNSQNTDAFSLDHQVGNTTNQLKRGIVQQSKTLHSNKGLSFCCEFCTASFENNKHLCQHLKTHAEQRITTSDKRLHAFRTEASALNSDVVRHSEPEFSNNKLLSCEVCEAKFKTDGSLRFHMRSHAEEPFSCSFCTRKFSQNYSLKRHMMKHSGERHYAYPASLLTVS